MAVAMTCQITATKNIISDSLSTSNFPLQHSNHLCSFPFLSFRSLISCPLSFSPHLYLLLVLLVLVLVLFVLLLILLLPLLLPFLPFCQVTPTLEGSSAEKVMDGAYILSEYGVREGVPSLILISTGTEVALAVGVAKVSVKQWKIVLTQIQGGDRKSVHRRELSSTNDYHDILYLMQLAHTYHIKYYYISPSLLFLSFSLSSPLYFPLCLACPLFLSSPICILISISSSPLFCSVLLHSAIHYRKYRLQIMCTYVLYRCRAASSLT